MSDEHKKTRGAIKSSLTRFSNYFDYVKDNPEHVDILELESRLKQVETLIDQFNSVQLKIEQEDKDFEQNEDSVHAIQREEFETKFFKVTSAVKRFIQSSQPSSSVDQQQTQTYNLINSPDIKLPSLNIPNFDGSYDQWLFFRDTFCSLIHNNNSLSPIQKFHYLRLSLKGSAADVIKSLSISSENYQIAWQLLEERYENKQYIVNNHIKAIFELPIALKESHSNLRQILDGIQKHLRALDVLNLPVNQWDALLIYLITSKLDNTTLREWSLRTKSNELPTMTDFIQFLKDRCRLLESLENSNLDKSKHNHNNRQNSSNKSFLANKAFTAKCSFCSKNHSIYSCADFSNLSPQNRFNEVRRLNLCVNCLKSGHNVSACKSSFVEHVVNHITLFCIFQRTSARLQPLLGEAAVTEETELTQVKGTVLPVDRRQGPQIARALRRAANAMELARPRPTWSTVTHQVVRLYHFQATLPELAATP
nr:unnamed protein product [Callosobruchus analis]